MISVDSPAAPTSSATDVMTEYLASAKRGDWDAAYALLAKDMTVHIPGESAFAGEHHGREAAIEYIQAIRNHFMDGGIELEVIDMLASAERVVLLVRERFYGDDARVTIRRANVYRVRGGEIVEISIFEADQYFVDAMIDEIRPA
jgi:ketosteroid isomerase-like protein